jgi:1-aminocyclopropane-1-carboxylate deaminase
LRSDPIGGKVQVYFPDGSRVLYAHLGGAPAINGYSYYYKDG